MGLNNNNKIINTAGQNHDNPILLAKYHEKPHIWALNYLGMCALGYAPHEWVTRVFGRGFCTVWLRVCTSWSVLLRTSLFFIKWEPCHGCCHQVQHLKSYQNHNANNLPLWTWWKPQNFSFILPLLHQGQRVMLPLRTCSPWMWTRSVIKNHNPPWKR